MVKGALQIHGRLPLGIYAITVVHSVPHPSMSSKRLRYQTSPDENPPLIPITTSSVFVNCGFIAYLDNIFRISKL